MIKIDKIASFLNKIFPYQNAEIWDKVGLIYNNINHPVDNVLVALDLTTAVMDFAVEKKCQLIVVHHPFLFEKTKQEEWQKAPYKEMLHKRLINNDISLLVLHTNYDNNKHGTAAQLIKTLNFNSWHFINNNFYGVIVETNLNFQNLIKLITKKMHISNFQTNFDFNSKIMVNKIAFLPGSGSPENIVQAHKKGAGLIFTSDVKWSTWLMAKEHKIKLIDYSHSVENVFVHHVCEILKNKFLKLNIYSFSNTVENYFCSKLIEKR